MTYLLVKNIILQDTEKSRVNSTNKVFTAFKNANHSFQTLKAFIRFLHETRFKFFLNLFIKKAFQV
ncbi:hypothetical protein HPG27_1522 [Helicobacter pylori G27]|uniref:Uncharacterized protein n=1 Tax=Helicobacter pylori (strain G27) TaxID=563041 RepID=B5Z9L5_HELPG|nr:hypothetical protein HPG27_1522 [Helicobacter pylori G27]